MVKNKPPSLTLEAEPNNNVGHIEITTREFVSAAPLIPAALISDSQGISLNLKI